MKALNSDALRQRGGPGTYCPEKTRSGAACKALPMANGRCRMHGGNYDAAGPTSLPSARGSAPARSPALAESPDKRKTIQVKAQKNELPVATLARAAIDPTVQSTGSCLSITRGTWEGDAGALYAEIAKQVAAVNSGDMSRPEAMLLAQAHTLDAIFNKMIRKASEENAGTERIQMCLGIAFKAQSQCRTTLQTLVDVKYPRQATFIKQANVAHGPQQINNGAPVGDPAREVSGEASSQLLTGSGHAALDSRGTKAAIGTDSHLATVGKIDGAEDAER